MTHQGVTLEGGRSLHVRSAGTGRPIVLLHGALTTHADWLEAPLAEFGRRGRALAVDRPGHGESRRPRFEAAPAAQARQIRDGLAAMEIGEPPLLVGHSFGGLVALAWASLFPDQVAGVLLLAPLTRPELRPLEHLLFAPRATPMAGPLLAEAARWSIDRPMVRLAQRAMFSPGAPPEDWLARYPLDQVLQPGQMVEEGEDAASVLPGSPAGLFDTGAIRAPVSIVAGDSDVVADPHRHAKRLHAELPGSRLTILEGVGHMPHHVALTAVLETFDELLSARVPATAE